MLHRNPARVLSFSILGGQVVSNHGSETRRSAPHREFHYAGRHRRSPELVDRGCEHAKCPGTTPWRRGLGFPILLLTGLAFKLTDNQISNRQLYEVAELGKPLREPTACPEFMQLRLDPGAEIFFGREPRLSRRSARAQLLFDKGDPEPRRKLTFDIRVSDSGRTRGVLLQRRTFTDWQSIGRIEFDDAVASYNGDFVLHFHHPPWRNYRNDPSSRARQPRMAFEAPRA